MKISVIICAAGKGERAGLNKNKVLAPFNGQPVIYTAVEKFYELADEIIIACSLGDMCEISQICSPFGATVIAGGKTRFESVYNALGEVSGDIVLIHDAARPFVDRDTILRCIEGVKEHRSAICAVALTDTAAECQGDEIYSVPDRSALYRLQTPQGFFTEDIKRAYESAIQGGGSFTDDSSVYLKYVSRPHIVQGNETNVKLTFKSDFDRQYPEIAAGGTNRIGFGSDVHAFGGNKTFVTLCGVKIENDCGLIAHSDGDVPVHAIMDAVLSAAGLDDIGHYFPDTDSKFSGADSLKLLKKVIQSITEKGFALANVSVAIQAETPRLSAHIAAMKAKLAQACKLPAEAIGISAGTGEALGFVGEKRGIAATAAVLLKKI